MSSLFTAPRLARHTAFRLSERIAHVALIGALVLSSSASAAEAPLTLAQARHLAIDRSRQLVAKDYAVAASREMAIAAKQLPDPVLKLGIDNLPVNGEDRYSATRDFMTMRRVGVAQEFTRADKRMWRANRFDREAEKTLAEKDVTAAAIERDATLAWLDRYYAEAMAAVIAQQAAQARIEMQAALGAYRAGRGTQADIFVARSALATIDDRASQFQRRIRNATVMLARWIGTAAELPLGGQPVIDTIRLDPSTLDTQLAHHPEIAVLNKQEEIAQADAQLAQANRKSDWSVEVAFEQRGPAFSNMISVGVSIPLQWDKKNRQDRELSSKLAMVEQTRAERDEMLRAHVAETRTMINEWENDRERTARYQHELIPLAQQRTAATITSYRGGKASLSDVLASRRNEIDVRLQTLELESDTARIWAQLNFLFPETAATAHTNMTLNRSNNEK